MKKGMAVVAVMRKLLIVAAHLILTEQVYESGKVAALSVSSNKRLDTVQTPGECCIFAEHDDLGVIWIFCHLFTGLDKFYGFCSD